MYVKEITVEAAPGDIVEKTIVDSIPLVFEHQCDVVVIHNSKRYRVKVEAIKKLISVAPEGR
jgi:hypothetical protein